MTSAEQETKELDETTAPVKTRVSGIWTFYQRRHWKRLVTKHWWRYHEVNRRTF